MIKPSIIFVTGNAGTGKTTLLKHITGKGDQTPDTDNAEFIEAVDAIEEGNKIVVAPTGVAAINAGGVTINSFFQINPYKKYNPLTIESATIYSEFKIKREKREIIDKLDVLIIDEISMVKAEVLDLIDKILRVFRGKRDKPFGGVQVVVIGDLFQLPPIKKDPNPNYITEYFFSSQVFKECYFADRVKIIELKKIYRQKSDVFVSALNNIRDGSIGDEQLSELNTRVLTPESDEGFITITTHNHNADQINTAKYNQIQAEEKVYKAEVWGEFKDDFFKAAEIINLKVGAQVMVVKNNNGAGYYNGMIGTVVEMHDEHVMIDTGQKKVKVNKETWKRIEYGAAGDLVKEHVIGEFTQIPLKHAWAITIHKSQGLSFDKLIADVDASFECGQVYVALSRCTSLEGLYLKNPIPKTAIKIDKDVVSFTNYVRTRREYQA